MKISVKLDTLFSKQIIEGEGFRGNGAGSGTGTAALGGASLGMPAARTDLMGGSSSLRTSPGIPGCTAALLLATGDSVASSAAT